MSKKLSGSSVLRPAERWTRGWPLIVVAALWINIEEPNLSAGDRSGEVEAKVDQENRENQIEYIEFNTTDIAATKKFYSAVFGWRFTDYGPDYTSFEDGRLSGGFATAEAVGTGGPLVVIYATDLPAVEAKVKENSGSVVKTIFSPGRETLSLRRSERKCAGRMVGVLAERPLREMISSCLLAAFVLGGVQAQDLMRK